MTDANELLQEFKDAKKSYEKLVKDKGKLLLQAVFVEMFETCPQVKRIGWCQYTPYFNDGDSCTFSVNDRYFDCGVLPPEDEREGDPDRYADEEDYACVEDWAWLPYDAKAKLDDKWNGASKPTVWALKKLDDKLNELEDVFEDTFGDHVKVIASLDKNGKVKFEVTEEEHD